MYDLKWNHRVKLKNIYKCSRELYRGRKVKHTATTSWSKLFKGIIIGGKRDLK